jgi:arylsulfatase A-like enzyme
VVEELDWSVGQVLAALRKNGLEQNTLVVFTSDNGPWLAFDVEGGSPGPLREGKQTTFEGGMRVPTVAYWPGRIKAGSVYDNLATTFDWFPTFLGLAGETAYQPKNPLDGEDITPVLTGTGKRQGDELLYYFNGAVQAYRKGDWKLKLPYAGNRGLPGVKDVAPHDTLLFNLKQDVGERTNLAKGASRKGAGVAGGDEVVPVESVVSSQASLSQRLLCTGSPALAAAAGALHEADLLQSQFETLEEPDDALVINIDQPPEAIVAEIRKVLNI